MYRCLSMIALLLVILSIVYIRNSSFSTKTIPAYYHVSSGVFRAEPETYDRIIVLLWTRYWGKVRWDGWDELGSRPFTLHDLPSYEPFCSSNSCHITTDRAMLSEAHVVAFHCRDAVTGSDQLTTQRQHHQLFVLFCHESPHNLRLDKFDEVGMNASATYRLDSDFPFPWGKLVRRNVTRYVPRVAWKHRSKSVLWFVSHCNAPSKRDIYVEELAKHIDVDVFGACGNKSRCKRFDSCEDRISDRYKFYLSMENNLCLDYVTEKFYRALSTDLIPIVLGPADYTPFAPGTTSFINARDFSSPRALATLLREISRNHSLYLEYMSWKEEYRVQQMGLEYPLNDVCEAVATGSFSKPAHELQDWWQRDVCDNNVVSNGRPEW